VELGVDSRAGVVLVGKFLIVTPLVKAFHYPLKTALIAGLGLAQMENSLLS